MGFCSLQHTGSEVHLTRALPAHYVPPSGFGHPLDGFLPSIPCRFFFAPAALMGFTLRSFLLPKGIRTFPSGRTHLPFLPPVYPVRSTGPARQAAVPGFQPFQESLATRAWLAHLPLAAPLGFSLLGLATKTLAGISPDLLPRALGFALRLGVSISLRSGLSAPAVNRGMR
jgi:hypothetical protein